MFTTCSMMSRVVVRYLFGTCPKIEQLDPAPLERIMGGLVMDIAPMLQLSDTTMVGRSGPDLGELHHFGPIDIKRFPKIAGIPKMEKGHVHTDMAGVQTVVLGKLPKDPVQVRDVIDVRQRSKIWG